MSSECVHPGRVTQRNGGDSRRTDDFCSCSPQNPDRLVERGTGRDDIVDDEDAAAHDIPRPHGAHDVAASRIASQCALIG